MSKKEFLSNGYGRRVQQMGDPKELVDKYVGVPRQVVVNTTENRLHVMDGETPGGHPVARLDEVQYETKAEGGVVRTIVDKLSDTVSVKDFGAKGDGVTDDTAAIQAALDSGSWSVYLPKGVYICTKEINVTKEGQRIYGAGMGSGYIQPKFDRVPARVVSAVTNWTDCTTLLFKGSGDKRIRTRVRYRASAEDPQDDPLSVCLNVQAEGVRLDDFTIRLWCEAPEDLYNDSVENLGADYDVGLFIGSRGCFSAANVGVIGYHRQANIWVDSTQGLGLPRFSDENGKTYPESTGVQNGTDNYVLDRVHTSGGLWGLKIQGCKQKDDGEQRNLPYYDELLGKTTTDYRGGYGASDFLLSGCQIFGGNHHTQRRFFDMPGSPNPETDSFVGGSFYIDGYMGNQGKAIHGHRYVSCRFMSFAPFCVYLGRTARDLFLGCMIEAPQGYVRKNDGTVIGTQSESTYFGQVYLSPRHDSARFIGTFGSFFYTYSTIKSTDVIFAQDYPDSNDYTLLSARERVYLTHHLPAGSKASAYLVHGEGESSALYLGTQDEPYELSVVNITKGGSTAQLRFGSSLVKSETDKTLDGTYRQRMMDVVVTGDGSATVLFPGNTALCTQGSLDIRNTANNTNTTLAKVYTGGTLATLGPVRNLSDNAFPCGMPEYRWTNVYAASGSINTSDKREKESITEPDDAIIRAWEKVRFKVFQFRDAVAKKGADSARLHVGVVAQEVLEAFSAEGLDATRYGLLCYDKWDDEYEDVVVVDIPEVVDDEGLVVTPEKSHIEHRLVTPAGDRYGIRYEEALALECAYLRHRMKVLENRLSALESA